MRHRFPVLAMLFATLGCTAPPQGIEITDPQIRIAPAAALTAAGYFRIRNHGTIADTLLRVTSDAARRVAIEETMDHDGVSMMMGLSYVVVEAGDSVIFASGGKHVMFDSLSRPLSAGDSVRLTLHFAIQGVKTLTVPVRVIGQ